MIRKLIVALALIAGTATVTLSTTSADAWQPRPHRFSSYTAVNGDVCDGAHHDAAWLNLVGKYAYNTHEGWTVTNPTQTWTRWRDLPDVEQAHWQRTASFGVLYACSLEPYAP